MNRIHDMKLQAAGNNVKTQVMDHHGIVAAVCKRLKIAERINAKIGGKDPRRIVQPGTAIVAMIINALGFTNRRLYLTTQFYESKAVEHLLGQNISAADLDDHCLGKSLDEASAYGVTKLYGELAFDIAIEEDILGKYAHLDSTSFVLEGEYANATSDFRVGLILENNKLPQDTELALNAEGTLLYYLDKSNKIKVVKDLANWWPDADLALRAADKGSNLPSLLSKFLAANKLTAIAKGLRLPINIIDMTQSINISGNSQNDPQILQVKYGHSKDHRPDLKQVMLSLVVNGVADVPIWMEPQDGNSSDKSAFHETMGRTEAFKRQLQLNHDFTWVADSALYTADKLLKHDNLLWISRVPENIKDCKGLLELDDAAIAWEGSSNGYRYAEVGSSYGSIKQRWIIISSEQAYNREKTTFDKKLINLEEQAIKAGWHLSKEIFNCEHDAAKALAELCDRHKFFNFTGQNIAVEKHSKKGRPKKYAEPVVIGYQITPTVVRNQLAIEVQLRKKGRFIIATNDINNKTMTPLAILTEYKNQQSAEGGFKFLKDPWFMVDSFFVKKPNRIAALMMVMTLSLLVYNFAQYELRKALRQQNETLPNQIGKQVQNPTLRWIFQIMEGIGIVKIYDPARNLISAMITNLDELRLKIIRLFGGLVCEMYGI